MIYLMCPHSNYMFLEKCRRLVGGDGEFKGSLLLNEYIFPKTNYATWKLVVPRVHMFNYLSISALGISL